MVVTTIARNKQDHVILYDFVQLVPALPIFINVSRIVYTRTCKLFIYSIVHLWAFKHNKNAFSVLKCVRLFRVVDCNSNEYASEVEESI